MRARQRLLSALVVDIIADIDDKAREIVLTIHWRGGQHSQVRVRKPTIGVIAQTDSHLAIVIVALVPAKYSMSRDATDAGWRSSALKRPV
jgi:hypothetical protein